MYLLDPLLGSLRLPVQQLVVHDLITQLLENSKKVLQGGGGCGRQCCPRELC
jgi:hypothetical protein